MIKTRKEKMLEARIARLEKLINSKNENYDHDALMQEMTDDLMSSDGMDYDEWIETLEAGAAGELDDTVEWYAEEYDLPEDEVRHMLMRVANQCLRDIKNGRAIPLDDDDDWDDEDELMKHVHREARKRVSHRSCHR